MRANLTGFYDDYRDWQAAFRIPGLVIAKTGSVAKSELYGAEAEINATFGDFNLDFNLGYLHSEIRRSAASAVPGSEYGPGCPGTVAGHLYDACPGGVAPAGVFDAGGTTTFLNQVGLPLNYAPELTINVSAQYDFHIFGGTLTPRLQFSHLSDQWVQLYHASQDYIPAHDVMDLRLAYTAPEHWRAEVFAMNLTDELYVTGVNGGAGATPYQGSLTLGAPRQVGLQISYSY